MTLAADQARPRPDLTFLRHRRRPARSNPVIAEFIASHSPRPGGSVGHPAAASTGGPAGTSRIAPTPTAPRPAPAGPSAPTTPPPAAPPPQRPAATTSLDLDAPAAPPGGGSASLDLDAPAPAASSGASTSLDLGSPPTPSPGGTTSLDPAAPSRGGSTSLDLGVPPATAPSSLDLGGPPATSTSLDLGGPGPSPASPPGGSTSLDLDGPPAATPPSPPPSTTSLDLGAAPVNAPALPTRSMPADTSLDLGGGGGTAGPAQPTTHPSALATPSAAAGPTWVPQRTDNRIPTVLQPSAPEVVLDHRQSAIGTLTIDAVVGADVGDLRLGAAYQLTSGLASTVQHSTGRRFAPASERQRPVLLASRGPGEQLEIDLRQVRDLERVVVYAFSGSGAPLQWGGTLRISTFGGAKIEIPLDQPPSAVVTVIATIYQVDGELVIRAERDLAGRTIKEACRAYGFDRVSWLDEQTPVD